MVVPVEWFGGNSDGGMAMEDWLAQMCPGCRHGRTEGGMVGMGCTLPSDAYIDPYSDILAWSPDADPPGPDGLTCMAYAKRSSSRRPRAPRGQLSLIDSDQFRGA